MISKTGDVSAGDHIPHLDAVLSAGCGDQVTVWGENDGVDGIVETEVGPEGGPTVSALWMHDECAKRLVSEGLQDSAVRGNEQYCCEMDVECALGDAVHEKYNEAVSIF